MSQAPADQPKIPSIDIRAPLAYESQNMETEEDINLKQVKNENNLIFFAGTLLTVIFVLISISLAFIYFKY